MVEYLRMLILVLCLQKSKSLTGELALVCRLCVAVKRKLQCYYWKQNGLLDFGKDIDLNDVPKTIAWNNNCICVGFKTEYVIYDVCFIMASRNSC